MRTSSSLGRKQLKTSVRIISIRPLFDLSTFKVPVTPSRPPRRRGKFKNLNMSQLPLDVTVVTPAPIPDSSPDDPGSNIQGQPSLRKCPPYWHANKTFAKGRWLNREILEMISTEFRDRSVEYYVSRVKGVRTISGLIEVILFFSRDSRYRLESRE